VIGDGGVVTGGRIVGEIGDGVGVEDSVGV
jgi:hypothetical protein